MTEKTEQPEHSWPWPFEGRIPLYVNGVQEGWVGPILSIEPMGAPVPVGEFEGAVVVDVEISEDGSMTVDGEPVETKIDPQMEEAVKKWFHQVFEDPLCVGLMTDDDVEVVELKPGDDPFKNFKFTVEGSSADA